MDNNTNTPNPPANYRQLEGSERHAAMGATRIGPADPAEIVNVLIVLRSHSGAPPLPDHEYWMNTPPGKRKFLTAEESARQYAAAPAEMQAVRDFLLSKGFTIDEANSKSRSIAFSGTVTQMNEAFAVALGNYQTPTQRYRGHEGYLFLPATIAGFVVGIFGLDNRQLARRHDNGTPAGASALTVQQVMQLYDFPTSHANGQAVGLFEFWEKDTTGADVPCGFTQSDIDTYFSNLQPARSSPSITTVSINGAFNNPLGNNEDGEVTLDIDVAGTVAKEAAINVYFTHWDEKGWADAIQAVIQPSPGQPTNTSVVSISWGWPEFQTANLLTWSAMNMSTIHNWFQQAAVQGITVFVSSGDYGSSNGMDDGACHVEYPGSDSFVTCCGGTIITNVNGNFFDEGTWNDSSGATGGGVSDNKPDNALPPWQANANVPASKNSGFNGRGIPDIAGNASSFSGYVIWIAGQSTDNPPTGGTSMVAPLYAGLMAIINAALGEPVGFLNPTLYALPAALIFNDIADGVNNELSGGTPSPSYTSVKGWDACTGLGSLRGKALLQQLQQVYTKNLEFIVNKSTFGLAECQALAFEQGQNPTGLAIFSGAMFVTIDGFKPVDLNISTLNPDALQLSQWAPVINTAPPLGTYNVTITPSGISSDDPSLSPEPQRFTFTYDVKFFGDLAFSLIPAGQKSYTIMLSLTSANPNLQPFLGSHAEIELTLQPDPYFNNASIDPDIKVFQLDPNESIPGFPQLTLQTDPLALIVQLLNVCNTTPSGPNHPYEAISTSIPGGPSDFFGPDPFGLAWWPVFLPSDTQFFAIARVRYRALTALAPNVRVFFRMYSWDSIPVYNASTNNKVGGLNGTVIPLLGTDNFDQLTSIPFFAFTRVDATAQDMNTQTDMPNVQTLVPDATGKETFAYFGCWLDFSSPTALYEPFPTPPNGPFGGMPLFGGGNSNPALEPIMPLMFGNFNMNAEINVDQVTIPPGATSQTSDKLARIEISYINAANPGKLASRRVPMPFKFRPNLLQALDPANPDELMIDWTHLPAGSTATIYLPSVDAAQLIQTAAELYPHHALTLVDVHTLQCVAGGILYIPIPHGLSIDYSGLLSVDLPFGITKGQVFTVTIRQITDASDLHPRASRIAIRWRRVIGQSTMRIPVSTKEIMLGVEEKRLAGLLYARDNRSLVGTRRLIFQRMLDQVRERFVALGGDPATVIPSNGSKGSPGGNGGRADGSDGLFFTGKVKDMSFDRFGDFSGFSIEDTAGGHVSFETREPRMKELIQYAWTRRILLTVHTDGNEGHCPASVVLHEA